MKNINGEDYYGFKATFFDQLASFYKYRSSKLFIQTYRKHFEYVQKLNKAKLKKIELHKSVQTTQKSSIRFIHAALNESTIDVAINGLPIHFNLSFKDHTNYIELPSGELKIEIYLSTNSSTPIFSKTILVDEDQFITLALTKNQTKLSLTQFLDNPTLPLGESKIRFIHLATTSPNLSLAVKQGEGDVVFSNIAAGEMSNYLPISPMSVNLEIRLARTKKILYPLYQSKFEQNKMYDIIAIDLANDDPKFEVLIVN